MNEKEALLAQIKQLEKENQTLKELINARRIDYKAPPVKKNFTKEEKIKIYMNYFRGRMDVFAEKFISKGKKGYNKVCENKFKPCCNVFKIHCQNCHYFKPRPLNEERYFEHLKKNPPNVVNKAYGIYPLVNQTKCYFLAIDFDDEGYQSDALAFKKQCQALNIDTVMEISQSGKGAHVWIFFSDLVKASDARILGDYLLTKAIEENPDISFKSYDRFFPSQDFVSDGQYGNLIALPLEGNAFFYQHTTLFVDDDFKPYDDQIGYLSTIKKVTPLSLSVILEMIKNDNDLLELDEKNIKKLKIKPSDLPPRLDIIFKDDLYIDKNNLSVKTLTLFKRLACMYNPEFYEKQAKRLSTYDINRIIELYHETDQYITLPRGTFDDLKLLLQINKIKFNLIDERPLLSSCGFKFQGALNQEQSEATLEMLKYENGILVAPTGSGKTVMAIEMIAKIDKPTLIIVESINLLKQWQERISQFLSLNNEPFEAGQYYGQKKKLTKIVDVASIMSLEKAELIENYEVVIIDEVHHIASKMYEKIIRKLTPRYLFGFTATPKRSDQLEKIVYKTVGPIRYLIETKTSDFVKYLKPVFTFFKNKPEYDLMNYSNLCLKLYQDEERNKLICQDIINEYQKAKNILILTKRLEHIDILQKMLLPTCPNLIAISGKSTSKEKAAFKEMIPNLKKQFIIISTGDYLGEGFDLTNLNTLFNVMPLKWEGLLKQYIGRIERKADGKDQIIVYDYVDIKIGIFANMFKSRLKEYQKQSYQLLNNDEKTNIIYQNDNYLDKLNQDLKQASNVVLLIRYAHEKALQPFFMLDANVKVISNLNLKIPNKIYFEKRNALVDAIIIDQKIIWYGSLNPFIYHKSTETIMRLIDAEYAEELISNK